MSYLLDTNACIQYLIGPYDLMIAAIALANQITLITHNIREFSRVRQLDLQDWEQE
jgi:tRNA(fMet)-specific endonuclease VapC